MTSSLRRLLRKHLPVGLRTRRVLLQRYVVDRARRVRFAGSHGEPEANPHLVCAYSRPFIDYPGQEHVAEAKRRNQRLAAQHIDRILIAPGETFSMWQLIPRPTEREGYAPASALHEGALSMEVGGAICLLSTVIYNIALLGGLRIVERHCHSIDQYGGARYFEPGRDAAIEYAYLDLRFQNTHAFAVLLRVEVDDEGVHARLFTAEEPRLTVEVLVDEPAFIPAPEYLLKDPSLAPGQRVIAAAGRDGFEVAARRRIRTDDGEVVEPLPFTHHNPVAAVVAVGPAVPEAAATSL